MFSPLCSLLFLTFIKMPWPVAINATGAPETQDTLTCRSNMKKVLVLAVHWYTQRQNFSLGYLESFISLFWFYTNTSNVLVKPLFQPQQGSPGNAVCYQPITKWLTICLQMDLLYLFHMTMTFQSFLQPSCQPSHFPTLKGS